ncbi:hypothetical protein [Pseudonocardia sp. McavD-2-B]|uniref:hypothetical protein n=1 Tax=Pseudonocardia sp. McavD-2-B TaxID=2954499 RepID=UPI002097A7CE|nr:hypothetical protein [Pseudonocardia sp. McavD-2-B]MCO7192555.1 hypothetical protein [Pseudonocardia sp. McavD-2-B]
MTAKDLGISESCLRRWMAVDDFDAGRVEDVSSSERSKLVELRRRNRVLEMEVEILKRAIAYFARESIVPRHGSRWSENRPRTGSPSR